MKKVIISRFKQSHIHEFSYLKKWIIIGILIGIIAGVGSIIFLFAIQFFSYIFLGLGAGYYPPIPAGEKAGLLDFTNLHKCPCLGAYYEI